MALEWLYIIIRLFAAVLAAAAAYHTEGEDSRMWFLGFLIVVFTTH